MMMIGTVMSLLRSIWAARAAVRDFSLAGDFLKNDRRPNAHRPSHADGLVTWRPQYRLTPATAGRFGGAQPKVRTGSTTRGSCCRRPSGTRGLRTVLHSATWGCAPSFTRRPGGVV